MREIPSIPAGLDPKLRNVLSAIRESLNSAILNINLAASGLSGVRQWIAPATELGLDLTTFNQALIDVSLASATGADGAAGIAAKGVSLTTPNQAFAYNSLGLSPVPASSVMTATGFNTGGVIYYEFFLNDVSTGYATTTNTYTYTPRESFDYMPDKLEVQIREDSVEGDICARDMMTLFGLKEGSNGITVVLSNEAHTLPKSVAGVVTYTGSGTTIKVWQGITALIEDSVSPYANSTFRVAAAGSGVSPGSWSGAGTEMLTYGPASAMTTDPASVIFTITVTLKDGAVMTVTKQQSLSFSNAGVRGSRAFYAYGSSWSDSAALAAIYAVYPLATYPDGAMHGDSVTISNNGSFVMVKYWDGSSWVAPGVVIDGSLIVTNSITAAQINSNGLSIKDAYGNTIISAGTALDFAHVGGGTKPANNATVGAYLGNSQGNGGNISGQLNGVYIADATIQTLHMANNAVGYGYVASGYGNVAKNVYNQVLIDLPITTDTALTASMLLYVHAAGSFYITAGTGTAEAILTLKLKNSSGTTLRNICSVNQYAVGSPNSESFSLAGFATGTYMSMPAGNYNIQFVVSHLNGTTTQSIEVTSTNLIVQFMKR